MKIGMIDEDFKGFPNLALMKLSSYHKKNGDSVEWATPLEHYDILYRSKIFNFTKGDPTIYQCEKEIRGGTGYDIKSKLPTDVEKCNPDYSLYNVPDDMCYGFTTRGCPNRCKWCVVPKKEGEIRPENTLRDITEEYTRRNAILLDNNILAHSFGLQQIEDAIRNGISIDINQAMDARLVTEDIADILAKVKWHKNRIRFGCDTHSQIEDCDKAIAMLRERGCNSDILLYTMLSDDENECVERISHFRDEKNRHRVACHAQPFRAPNNVNDIPSWQKKLARWTNRRRLYFATPFEDYAKK